MKSLSAILKEARETAGLTQQDLLRRVKDRHRRLSLRALSKVESGGTCKAGTLEVIMEALPMERHQREELVAAWHQVCNRQFAPMVDVRPASGRSTGGNSKRNRMLALIDTLPRDKQDLISEMIQDPDGMKVLEWSMSSYAKLKKLA